MMMRMIIFFIVFRQLLFSKHQKKFIQIGSRVVLVLFYKNKTFDYGHSLVVLVLFSNFVYIQNLN